MGSKVKKSSNQTAKLDPLSRPLLPIRRFSELWIGEKFPLPARTITYAHFSAFQALTGDNHPIHYDREYCKVLGHHDLLAHGLHVLSLTSAGAGLFPHVIGPHLIGFIEVSAKFLRGVFPDDTIYPMLEIVGLKPQRTTGVVTMSATLENQHGERVLEGTQTYLLRRE
ncbi:MAG: MaoC family dehydratase [Burkholderiaceae bacterium]|nr:MaoC family dehydratase [Burkholderiaceae bacterium]